MNGDVAVNYLLNFIGLSTFLILSCGQGLERCKDCTWSGLRLLDMALLSGGIIKWLGKYLDACVSGWVIVS